MQEQLPTSQYTDKKHLEHLTLKILSFKQA